MESHIITQLLEITKVLAEKGSAFIVDIKIDNNSFKISNHEQKDLQKPQWRKTPNQIQRDYERHNNFITRKKEEEFSDVSLADKDRQNDQAHKVIRPVASPIKQNSYLPLHIIDKEMINEENLQNTNNKHDSPNVVKTNDIGTNTDIEVPHTQKEKEKQSQDHENITELLLRIFKRLECNTMFKCNLC